MENDFRKSKQTRPANFFKEWLETLQQESWQLELLISGFALFGIWEARQFIYDFEIFIQLNPTSKAVSFLLYIFLSLLKTGWMIFIINLLAHIILRGFWIGAIGLRYVSGEIDYEDLDYSESFTNYLREKVGDYDDFIERLEKLCSVIFAFTFLLFFLFLSLQIFMIFCFIPILISDRLGMQEPGKNPALLLPTFLYLFMGLIVFIDFLSFGGLKRLKEGPTQKVYMFIFKIISYSTLSFLYRPLLYNFIDDKYTRRLIILSIPYFIAVLLIIPRLEVQSYPFFPTLRQDAAISDETILWLSYDDLREKHLKSNSSMFKEKRLIYGVSLGKFEVREDYVSLFLRHNPSDRFLFEEKEDVQPFYNFGLSLGFGSDDGADKKEVQLEEELHQNFKDVYNKRNEYSKSGNIDTYKSKLDSIIKSNNESKAAYHVQKITNFKDELQSIFQIQLDGEALQDSLYCKFFIHPNAKERGLLCYLPVKELNTGPHELIVKRKTLSSNKVEDSVRYVLPFIKL